MQTNAHFSNLCFNSLLGVFYMFRTSFVHHQEDHLYMQFCMACFSYIYISSLAGGRMCSIEYILPHTVKTAWKNGLLRDEKIVF